MYDWNVLGTGESLASGDEIIVGKNADGTYYLIGPPFKAANMLVLIGLALQSASGYNGSATQGLAHVNGTLTWKDTSTDCV